MNNTNTLWLKVIIKSDVLMNICLICPCQKITIAFQMRIDKCYTSCVHNESRNIDIQPTQTSTHTQTQIVGRYITHWLCPVSGTSSCHSCHFIPERALCQPDRFITPSTMHLFSHISAKTKDFLLLSETMSQFIVFLLPQTNPFSREQESGIQSM